MSEGFIDKNRLTDEQKEEMRKQGIDPDQFEMYDEEGEADYSDDYGDQEDNPEGQNGVKEGEEQIQPEEHEPESKRAKGDEKQD